MQQDREWKNRTSQIWPFDIWQRWKWRKYSISTDTLENLVTEINNTEIDINLTPYTKMNSKWIIDLEIRHQAIILLEENRRENLYGLRLGEELLEMTPKSWSIKAEKLDFFQSAKDTRQWKDKLQRGRKYL